MKPPYAYRIMAELPGHSPVEIFRSSEKYAQSDWDFWTRDMSPEWTCWAEYRMADKFTLTPRAKPALAGRVDRLPLTRDEMAGAGVVLGVGYEPSI